MTTLHKRSASTICDSPPRSGKLHKQHMKENSRCATA
jgi:hypothetical protein